MRYLNAKSASSVPQDMIRAVMGSVADTVIFPLQDVLGLGADARMNVPGAAEENWRWRVPPGKLTAPVAARLRAMTELFDRA